MMPLSLLGVATLTEGYAPYPLCDGFKQARWRVSAWHLCKPAQFCSILNEENESIYIGCVRIKRQYNQSTKAIHNNLWYSYVDASMQEKRDTAASIPYICTLGVFVPVCVFVCVRACTILWWHKQKHVKSGLYSIHLKH